MSFGLVAILGVVSCVSAGTITVPNGSFESPATPFISLNIAPWQRTPQPVWWNTNTSGEWNSLVGIFKNTPPGNFDHIDNCHSNQAVWLFARQEAGLFLDHDSVTPTNSFDANYEIGYSYQMTVGLLNGGMGSGGGVAQGATLEFSLYYRDAASNRVTVAVTSITNALAVFSNSTHLLDFSVNVLTVQPTDPWAGRHIGILLLSTVSTNLEGGYWDLDNVRLIATRTPVLVDPLLTNGQFAATLLSEPGLAFEILAATNPAQPAATWLSLDTLTNTTGSIPFVDTNANFDQRFYRLRQVP